MTGACLLLALAAALALPPATRWATRSDPRTGGAGPDGDRRGLVERGRPWWAVLAFVGGTTLASGPVGMATGLAAAGSVWVIVGRAEPAARRRHRTAVAADLPHLVDLIAVGLESGLAVSGALDLAVAAMPGAAADELRAVGARLRLGVPVEEVWVVAGSSSALAPLGRAMGRAQSSGASVSAAVRLLAEDLADRARLEVEDRARAVGVRAAVPLGVCLLPAFILLGVAPMVVGAAGAIAW